MFRQFKISPVFPRLSLAVLAILVLAACGSQPAAQAAPAAGAQPTSANASAPTAASSGASAPVAPATGAVSFSKDLAPLLQDSCVSCHGGEKTSKALDLKTYASLMTGSQNGAVVVPKDAANSKMVQVIQAGKMPKRGAKWTSVQLQLLVDWINAGAQNN